MVTILQNLPADIKIKMDTKTKRHFVGTGHIAGSLDSFVDMKEIPSGVEFCEHEAYCIIRKATGKICFNENNPRKQCQKFYDKYGEDYNSLGVGS